MQQEMRKKRVVGFDCDFVSPPPEGVQTECPICLLIIREPYQVTCCGKKFCQTCIDSVKTTSKPCPTCKTQEFSYFPDKGLKQSLYTLKVHCSHQREGCEWRGELKWLDTHLNQDPQPGKMLEGCPLTTISCDFHHVGCTEKLPRKDLPEHLRENLLTHLSLMVAEHSRVARSNEKLATDHQRLEGDYALLTVDHTSLSDKFKRLESTCNRLATEQASQSRGVEELVGKFTELKKACQKLKSENNELKSRLMVLELTQTQTPTPPAPTPTPPIIPPPVQPRPRNIIQVSPSDEFIMRKFEYHRQNSKWWYSNSIETHPQGYLFCLGVCANGNGTGRGTHLSVFIYFMRGDFDDYLLWPFRGAIRIQLCDQTGSNNHKTYLVVYDDSINQRYCERVRYTERATAGWGNPTLIPYNQLKPRYLTRDTLVFRIAGGEMQI